MFSTNDNARQSEIPEKFNLTSSHNYTSSSLRRGRNLGCIPLHTTTISYSYGWSTRVGVVRPKHTPRHNTTNTTDLDKEP